jgi:hypothetical protein
MVLWQTKFVKWSDTAVVIRVLLCFSYACVVKLFVYFQFSLVDWKFWISLTGDSTTIDRCCHQWSHSTVTRTAAICLPTSSQIACASVPIAWGRWLLHWLALPASHFVLGEYVLRGGRRHSDVTDGSLSRYASTIRNIYIFKFNVSHPDVFI